MGEKWATDGSPFETCCLCEVLGLSPERTSMFMTHYKRTYSALCCRFNYSWGFHCTTWHTTEIYTKKFDWESVWVLHLFLNEYFFFLHFAYPEWVLKKEREGVVILSIQNFIFSKSHCYILLRESRQSEVAQTNQHLNTPLCCLKWCLLILHTVPSANLSHAGFALTLLKLCYTASELWASIVKSFCTHTVCHTLRQCLSYTMFSLWYTATQTYTQGEGEKKKDNMIKAAFNEDFDSFV